MKKKENLRESEMEGNGISLYLMKKEDLKEVFCELMNDLLGVVEKQRKEEEDDLVTIEQASEMLECSRPTLWRWEKKGYLVPTRQGGKPLYHLRDINKVLKRKGNDLDKE